MAVFRKIAIIQIGILTTLFTFFIFGSSHSIATTSIDSKVYEEGLFTESDGLTRAQLVWRYKIENGYRYKRLYNLDTCEWIGDWILMGPV